MTDGEKETHTNYLPGFHIHDVADTDLLSIILFIITLVIVIK